MPAAKPPEFRRRAVELARLREKPVAEIAHGLGIAESCPRRWMKQDDIDAGRAEGLSTDERAELVRPTCSGAVYAAGHAGMGRLAQQPAAAHRLPRPHAGRARTGLLRSTPRPAGGRGLNTLSLRTRRAVHGDVLLTV
jgi:transposase-like protein